MPKTENEFEESIRNYYKDKQKEYPPERIYMDLDKAIKEEEAKQEKKDKFIYKKTEAGYEVEFNGTKVVAPTMIKAILKAYIRHHYNI